MGNNPRRQSVYGTTLAMLMSQLFKVINYLGKMHSAVLPKVITNMSEAEIKKEVEKNYQKIRLDIENLIFKEQNRPRD